MNDWRNIVIALLAGVVIGLGASQATAGSPASAPAPVATQSANPFLKQMRETNKELRQLNKSIGIGPPGAYFLSRRSVRDGLYQICLELKKQNGERALIC